MKRSKLVSCPSKQIRLGMLMRSNPAHMRDGNFAVPLHYREPSSSPILLLIVSDQILVEGLAFQNSLR
jgi:hypothetical protein